MAEQWYPQAIRVNGEAVNFRFGENRMEAVKLHFTVGINSWPIGYRGYFQFLIARDGTIFQFAEVGAFCFDSGEWNDAGPGIEVEYYPGVDASIFNDEMRAAASGLVHWLHDEHGFPLVKWGGDRISEFGGFRGFIDHADLIQTEQHYDFWPEEDWAIITGAAMASLDIEDFANLFTHVTGKDLNGTPITGRYLLDVLLEVKRLVEAAPQPPAIDVKALAAAIAVLLPAGSPVDARVIAEAVRDKFRTDPIK